jgi:hypothetical protein
VTTVLLASDGVAPRDLTREATAQEYFPEWVIVAPTLSDLTAFGRTYDQEQWANAFGVTHGAAPITPEIAGFYGLYQWLVGSEPPAKDTIGLLMPNYTLLAAVLQATGPDLTPENFRTRCSTAGHDAGDHAAALDLRRPGLWPDIRLQRRRRRRADLVGPDRAGPDEIRKQGTGMYVFVDGGTRYLPGEWPTESALFDPAGGITIYETPPPERPRPSTPAPPADPSSWPAGRPPWDRW